MATEFGEVVLVGLADFFDDAVKTKPFQQTFEEGLVVIVKEVEAAVAMLALLNGVGDLRQSLQARRRIIDGREEQDVTVVGCA